MLRVLSAELVVSDHADAMGAMNEIVAGNPDLMRDPTLRDWHDRINQGGMPPISLLAFAIFVTGYTVDLLGRE
jgi:hypothetical protein